MSSLQSVTLRVAVFAAGALLMALEVAAFRIIGKTFGSALRETTTVIAVFLAAMSVGYWAGGRIADRRPHASTLVGALMTAAASLLVVPWIDAALSPRIAASNLAMAAHAFLATSVLFALPTVLLAATSPIAIRLFTTTTGSSGSTAGSISAISTIGSIAGSIVTAFFLIDWLESISRTVLFVALGVAATALLVWASSREGTRTRFVPAAAATLLLVVITVVFVRSTSLDRALAAPLEDARVLYVADSPYHRVTVRERGAFRELYFNVAKQTRMRLHDPHGPGLAYTDAFHIAPLMRPSIRRILFIGLGGGTAAKQFLRHYPQATIDVVEIDPLVVQVARKWFAVPVDPRLRIHVADGRTFLKRSSEKWDLVVIDAYTTNRYGDTIPAHLTTREFFAEVDAHLSERGIVHFHCAFHQPRVLGAIQRTMASVFPSVLRTSGELLASRVPLIAERETLLAGLASSELKRLPHLARSIDALTAERLGDAGTLLLTDDYAPVDTLIHGQ
ncbi:MAG TPA: fused MFS/spermidine synthase [Thermoanaerobaculia bacterium]|nr:fused MFS/spermidine synthase [Thermoanaerobaculia bacterium]